MEVPPPVTGLQLVTGEVLDIRQEPARLPTNRIHSVDEAGPYTANLTVIWCRSDAGLDNAGAVGDRIAEAAWDYWGSVER